MSDTELWSLEEQFWTDDASFYDANLTSTAMMVFPAPVGIIERAEIIQPIQSAPRWQSVNFSQKHIARPNTHTTILAYSVQAIRDDSDTLYSVLCSSTYIRADTGWHLAFHQQTPSES